MQFFIILSSCENWVTQISKILIQLNSSHQYNHFEVQHAYVMIKIKEVVSNQIFFVTKLSWFPPCHGYHTFVISTLLWFAPCPGYCHGAMNKKGFVSLGVDMVY